MTKEALYDELRRRIITMDLKPGSDLDEGELSEAYAMSRTPVRETLIRLQTDGLVTQRRHRGTQVAPLDVSTLQSWFEAAHVIHRAMVRLACARREDADLDAIEAAMQEFEAAMAAEDKLRMIYANERFHDLIGRAARNPYFYASYRRILVDHERISELCYGYEIATKAEADKQLTLRQHRELVEAIRAGDAATAEATIDAHLNLCRHGVRQALEESESALADIAVTEA